MRSAVIVFPGSNCDRDMAVALERHTGRAPAMVWHKDASLPEGLDLVAIPGGFSFGDYLRCGAIAARSPIVAAVLRHIERGGLALGVCNGFQILIEAGALPGALMRNSGLRFVCRDVWLRVETAASPFTRAWEEGEVFRAPVAHHDGAYVADEKTLERLKGEGRVAFTYRQPGGAPGGNPNGSARDIAGILGANGRVLGMMPHPERLADPALGGEDGAKLFRGVAAALAAA